MQYTIDQIGQGVKLKYPGVYDNLSDAEVGQAFVSKHPEYQQVLASGQTGGVSTDTPSTSQPASGTKPSFFNRVAKVAQNVQDVAVGAAKGAVSTFKNAADLGEGGLNAVSNFFGIRDKNNMGPSTSIIPKTAYTTKNAAERFGFGAEQAAEFVAPSSLIKDAETAIDAASKANELGKFAQAALRVGGKAAVEAGANAAVRAAQTGGDIGETTKTALLFGLTKLGTASIGETLKAFNIPERLYNTVFKSTYQDSINELKTTALKDLQTSDPQFFQQAVAKGLIKQGTNGAIVVDETLAKEALDRGLKGSMQNMATAVVKGQLKSEILAQDIAHGFEGTIDVSEPQYYNVLKQVAQDYQDVGFGELSAEANQYASVIKQTDGQLTGMDALGLRRFLDKMRIASSFTQDNPFKLSTSQANFKYLADALRSRVNAISGMAPVMKDYSFYIDALDALAKEAKRRGNNQVLSLIDSIFFSTGLAAGNPAAGVSAGTIRKIINSPAGATAVGNAINESGAPTKAGTLIKAGLNRAIARPQPPEPGQ